MKGFFGDQVPLQQPTGDINLTAPHHPPKWQNAALRTNTPPLWGGQHGSFSTPVCGGPAQSSFYSDSKKTLPGASTPSVGGQHEPKISLPLPIDLGEDLVVRQRDLPKERSSPLVALEDPFETRHK